MKKTKPLISIIMNCHNGEKYLKKSLDSILNQTYKNWELIFWDNNSFDDSPKIVKRINDKRVHYFRGKKFVKLYKARNLAIEKASGQFICFLDTDDTWKKDFIKKHLKKINETNCDVVYSKYYIKNEINNRTYINEKGFLPSGKITKKLLKKYLVGINAILLKKNIFDKLKFKSKYQVIGDFDFFLRLSLIKNFCAIQTPLLIYRHHKSNFTNKNHAILIKELNCWIKENKKMFINKYSFNYINLRIIKLRIKDLLKKFIRV